MSWPKNLSINAWTGEPHPVAAPVSDQAHGWAFKKRMQELPPTLAPKKKVLADWTDERVGWGLVLPFREGLSFDELASDGDAPEPIRELRKARNDAPVFRYRRDSQHKITLLRNYGAKKDLDLSGGGKMGIADDALPFYLLIYAPPEEIPWRFQYNLNASRAAGRLDLTGEALENYVAALLNDWKDAASQVNHAIVWAVDHGGGDITTLMKEAIAKKLYDRLRQDEDIGDKARLIDGSSAVASGNALVQALSETMPGLVVTTSHGQTGPLTDLQEMGKKLGLLVDQDYKALEPDQLLSSWQPDGAIWYAHACCSAGSDDLTLFEGLVEAGSPVDLVLKGVTKLGAKVAPLPRALLGAKRPLRAFIGHVEPTFDWSLRQIWTGQHLTEPIASALYDKLYLSEPVGLGFREFYQQLSPLYLQYEQALDSFNKGAGSEEEMLYCQLRARDIQSSVILGDPIVALPELKKV